MMKNLRSIFEEPFKECYIEEVRRFVDQKTIEIMSYVNEKYQYNLNPSFEYSFEPFELNPSACKFTEGKITIYLVLGIYVSNLQKNKPSFFTEYQDFENDPHIGSLKNISWQQAATALITHEIAHCIQFDIATKRVAMHLYRFNHLRKNSKALKDHGLFWQAIYKDLREQFVNHFDNEGE